MRKDDLKWTYNKDGTVSGDRKNIENAQSLLNHTGCGFCLAKFTQVTMHLGTGYVHSCHHPIPHKISLDEIKADYRALFNTSHLKQARTEMLNNQKPGECDYCWRVEDSGNLSDRSYKSSRSWALDKHDEIVTYTGNETISPTYLEVSFSNVCNMSCLYCGPEFSSKWTEDLKQNGPIKLLENTTKERWVQGWQDLDNLNIPNREYNPYIDAFWKWFPEIYPNLSTYRITGGEPLMSKETFRSMDWLAKNPNPRLDFSINTNLNVPEKIWDKFIEKLLVIKDTMAVTVFTSIEAWGPRAEYIRRGLDFELFKTRYEQLAALGNVKIVIMAAYNVLSITSFKDLLAWQLEMKQKYNYNSMSLEWEMLTNYSSKNTELQNRFPSHSIPIGLDIPYVRHPKFLDAIISSDYLVKDYMIPTIDFMAANTIDNSWMKHKGFELNELYKLKQLTDNRLFCKEDTQDILESRAEFYDFINIKDARDNTKFLDVFPELESFYLLCKESKQRLQKDFAK